MKSMYGTLYKTLMHLPVHERQQLIDMIQRYPMLGDMVAAYVRLKEGNATPEQIQRFTQQCLDQTNA